MIRGMKPEIPIKMILIMMVINMMPIRIITMWMMLIMKMIELVVQMLVFINTSDTRGIKPEIPIQMITIMLT